MRVFSPLAAVLACSCSNVAASGPTAYDESVRCEMLTGILGWLHPKLTSDEVKTLHESNVYFNRRSEELGRAIGKTPQQTEDDRKLFLVALKAEFEAGAGSKVTDLKLQEARQCAKLSD